MAKMNGRAAAGMGVRKGCLPSARRSDARHSSKGIMFSVSVMLLALAMLSFADYLSKQALKAHSTVSSLLEIDRASDAYFATEAQLSKIASAAVNISAGNGTVFLSQQLPWDSGVGAYLERFRLFEENKSDLNLSFGVGYLAEGSFVIQPVNVSISQGGGEFSITPADSPQSAGELSYYDVNLTLPAGSFDSVQWENFSNSSGDTEMVRVRVVSDDFALVWPAPSNYSYFALDKRNGSSFNITLGGELVARVAFVPPAALRVEHGAGNIGLKASVGFFTPVYVETNDDISVRSLANKTGKLRIA